MGAGADLLSHECTFGGDMWEKARVAQHSTAPMAGSFARALGARALVLTHFSGRFLDFRKVGALDLFIACYSHGRRIRVCARAVVLIHGSGRRFQSSREVGFLSVHFRVY